MYKQHKLSAMMKVVKPEIEEANEKFKNADRLKSNKLPWKFTEKQELIRWRDVCQHWFRFLFSMHFPFLPEYDRP
jgi:membrane protein insertase Oxa1/YidC/SpoIIIJ